MPRIAFVHPDLGIGGAERLVVDAAVVLQKQGHNVTMYTSHHDPSHCFEETRDGTLRVVVHGDFLPRHFFRRFSILCSIIRGLYLALVILLSRVKYDVFIVDQLSIPILLLRLSGAKILFYCHFPDFLLSKRDTTLRKIYRAPFDKLEEWTTLMSHKIVVNSKFTASKFVSSFPSAKTVPEVLYPSINFSSYDGHPADADLMNNLQAYPTIVSINRFERKKNIALAVHAFALLKNREKVRLLIAGGYDPRVRENVEYLDELKLLTKTLGIEELVSFLPSFSDTQRASILSAAACIAYTPDNEHFGIVPVEAMFGGRPIVACSTGGPTESIIHLKTGLLCPSVPAEWAEAFEFILADSERSARMGREGRAHVIKKFSLDSFSRQLNDIVAALAIKKSRD